MTGSEFTRELLKHSTRHEAEVIEGVAIAAGYLWRCRERTCSTANDADYYWCTKCQRSRR